MPRPSYLIKQVLQKMHQAENVMFSNYEQVDSLSKEPISKTWIFEIALFEFFYVLKSRNLAF